MSCLPCPQLFEDEQETLYAYILESHYRSLAISGGALKRWLHQWNGQSCGHKIKIPMPDHFFESSVQARLKTLTVDYKIFGILIFNVFAPHLRLNLKLLSLSTLVLIY